MTELLKRGAAVDAATKKGNTALHIASLGKHRSVTSAGHLVQIKLWSFAAPKFRHLCPLEKKKKKQKKIQHEQPWQNLLQVKKKKKQIEMKPSGPCLMFLDLAN